MKNLKIVVTRKWPKVVEQKLQETFDTTLNEDDIPLTEDQLFEAMQNFDAMLPTVTDSINDRILSCSNRKVNFIGNFGVGYNNIDVDSAKKNNIIVTAEKFDLKSDEGASEILSSLSTESDAKEI